MSVKWHGKRVLATATNEIERAIARATIQLQVAARQDVSQGYPPPSSPGEAPHLRTSTLQNSIDQETFREGRDFVGRPMPQCVGSKPWRQALLGPNHRGAKQHDEHSNRSRERNRKPLYNQHLRQSVVARGAAGVANGSGHNESAESTQ